MFLKRSPPRIASLAGHPKVISAPHMAGFTNEARYRMSMGACEASPRLTGGAPANVVNQPKNPRYLRK